MTARADIEMNDGESREVGAGQVRSDDDEWRELSRLSSYQTTASSLSSRLSSDWIS